MATGAPTVAIIGLGFGRAHIPAFQAHGCPVVAVCQRDATAARAVADRHGIPEVYSRWDEMLERVRPGIVVVAAPPPLHLPIVRHALGIGAHVLCEKPLAMTVAEARAMTEAALRAGRVAMTSFNFRFVPAMRQLHAMVHGGYLGRLFHATARFLVPRWADESAAPTWRMDRAQAGSGALGDLGVHLIDLVLWNFGPLTRVVAHAGIAYPERTVPGGGQAADAEDYCTVVAETAQGAAITLLMSRAARGINDVVLEAYGTRGALVCRLDRSAPGWHVGELKAASDAAWLQPVAVPEGVPVPEGVDQLELVGRATIAPLVREFLDAIRSGRQGAPSFEDGTRAQAVLDAVLRSADTGGWIAIEKVA
jgi:predicted dehydrogenase